MPHTPEHEGDFLQDLASMFDTETEQFIVADERRFTSFLEEEVGRAEEVEQAEEGGFIRGLFDNTIGRAAGAVGRGALGAGRALGESVALAEDRPAPPPSDPTRSFTRGRGAVGALENILSGLGPNLAATQVDPLIPETFVGDAEGFEGAVRRGVRQASSPLEILLTAEFAGLGPGAAAAIRGGGQSLARNVLARLAEPVSGGAARRLAFEGGAALGANIGAEVGQEVVPGAAGTIGGALVGGIGGGVAGLGADAAIRAGAPSGEQITQAAGRVLPERVVEAAPAQLPPEPALPAGLRRSTPKFKQQFLEFESDVDKALYIVGNPKTKSKAHDKFIAFLTDEVGMTPGEIRTQGRVMRERVKGFAAGGGDVVIPARQSRTITQPQPQPRPLEGQATLEGGVVPAARQADEALVRPPEQPPEGPVARPIADDPAIRAIEDAQASRATGTAGGEPPPSDIGRQGILLEVPPTEIGENLLDLRPIQIRELGVVDRAVNAARATLGRLTNREVVLKNKLVKSAFDEVRRAQPRIISQANLKAATVSESARPFVRTKNGRITALAGVDSSVPGAPTIQDVAARRPRYLAALSDEQKGALERMRLEMEDYARAREEVGLEVSGRSDLVTAADPTEAGFYLPRGGSPSSPDVPRSTRGRGGRIGAEQRAAFASMAEALDDGATYFPLGDAIQSFGRNMGERLANLHAANFLQRLEVETGIPLGRAGGRPLPGEVALPSGSGVPSLRELRGTTFPPEITNAVNEILATQGELIGKGSEVLKAINAYNNFYRSARSTLDNSAIMIQGLLGSATDPQASARAMLLNVEIWKTGQARQIFGRFVDATDQHAVDVLGIPDYSRTAAQKGLILNGGETELTQSVITRVPGVRRAANAFGFYGDALRLRWLADEVGIEMARTGKTGAQIVEDGTMERLANAINPATGVTEGNRLTDIASIATFAPRFLQSRLTTVARGIRGLDVDVPLDILPSGVRRRIPIREAPLNPAARLEDRIARKALVRLIGYGVAITVGANAALGEETDFRIFVNGRLNPNFMRVRFGERDFSVLGTWDSIAKLIIGTAQGVSQGNINTILGSARGLGSGLVTQAWDLLSGRDFEGRETTSDPVTFAAHIGRSHLPFQAEELPAAGGKIVEGVREGDIGEIATGVTQIALEGSGAKSSPLSGRDQLDIATRSGNFSSDNFDDIEPFERNEVRDQVGDVFRSRGTPQDVFFDGIDQIESREPGTLGESDVGGREPRRAQLLAQAGTLSNNEILDEWFSIESDAAAERNGLRLGTGVEFDAERDEGEQLIEQWFAIFGIPSVRDKIGRAKFTELDKQRKAFLARLNPVQREFLLRNTHLRPVDPQMLRILERAGARGTVKNIRDSEAARERFRANPQRTDIGEVVPSPQPATPEPTVPTRTLDQLFGQRAQ